MKQARILIAGAGIAGLTAAIALRMRGFKDIRIVERSPVIAPLGSGINVLPHAVREFHAIGMLERLLPLCIPTGELLYMNHLGHCISRDPRGVAAGYKWPQLSIHRGWLQAELLQRVKEDLGEECVHAAQEVVSLHDEGGRHVLACLDRRTGVTTHHDADLVIGADGIRSAIRRALYPDEGPPPANGMVIFRGTLWGPSFMTGRSMIIAGDGRRKVVLYPMARRDSGEVLLNWAAALPENPAAGYARGDWNQAISPDVFAGEFAGWDLGGLSPEALMRGSADTFVYPMVDRDPLPRWSRGHVVLMGDAAHAMYPIGSNGATQSIIDACALAHHLDEQGHLGRGIAAYEQDRRPRLTALQAANRQQGPEVVIDIAAKRAPQGFKQASDVFAPGELAEIASRYTRISAMEIEQVNQPSPYRPVRAEPVLDPT
ncbi:MAG: FAD-dependent monooxygenase [Aquabacterium sp.]